MDIQKLKRGLSLTGLGKDVLFVSFFCLILALFKEYYKEKQKSRVVNLKKKLAFTLVSNFTN